MQAVKGDIEAYCECGAPTVALGLVTTLRPHGQPFANYVVLCRDCVALAAAEGMEIVWLKGQETEKAVAHHRLFGSVTV